MGYFDGAISMSSSVTGTAPPWSTELSRRVESACAGQQEVEGAEGMAVLE